VQNDYGRRFNALAGLQEMQAHGVGCRIMEHQREGIKLHHQGEPLCQFVNQGGQLAMRGDRIRHSEQRAVLVGTGGCPFDCLSA
jgi:hypothetical protein